MSKSEWQRRFNELADSDKDITAMGVVVADLIAHRDEIPFEKRTGIIIALLRHHRDMSLLTFFKYLVDSRDSGIPLLAALSFAAEHLAKIHLDNTEAFNKAVADVPGWDELNKPSLRTEPEVEAAMRRNKERK